MSGVRVLVGTRKGAFILTSDGKRERWDVSGPHPVVRRHAASLGVQARVASRTIAHRSRYNLCRD
jgi:hypothetical protein